ncbi:phage tail protein [Yersinia mollaretii]|uniref:phage tail protein n=1 Tax=Yersinia mollaretii TaxID=33060 RepID=UPI0011A6B3EF|nr:phage tail protein [Yersinia mollaretii]
MTARFFALLTNIGAAKLANATALGTRLEITQMAVGDGGGTLPTPNPAQTQLVNEQRRAALNTLSVDPINTSQIIAEQVIPEAEGGWWIREIGLLDKDGDLVAIANCAETYKPLMQEGSGRTQTIRVILIVSSTAAVTLKIDPSVVLATRKYVDDKVIEVKQYADQLLADHEKSRNHPDASKTEKGFVKLSSATTSDSEALAATPKAVKTVADNAAKALDEHSKAENPHSQYLQIANLLSEIKAQGPAALAETLENLGLGDVAHLPQLTGIVGTSRNAKMSIPAASVAATFTADELIVQTGWGGRQYKLSGFSRAINLATMGSGGMDTGTAPTTGYVALYAIYNPTSGATALLAVNATSAPAQEVYGGAHMPAGYTASALVSVWGTSSGQFVVGHQIGRHIGIISNQLYSTAGSVLGYSGISLATAVPPNGKKANMQIVASQTTPNSVIQLYLASTAEGVGAIYVNASANSSSATTTSTNSGYAVLDIIGVQTLYFKMANAVAATYTFICGGYEI